VGVSGLAKTGTVLLISLIVLQANASPMVHGVSEPLVAAVTHHNLPGLALCLVTGAVPLCARRA
jgi:hypothetical protein